MAPSDDSTVRIPRNLLERAELIEPENRSEVIRRACSIGLDHLEKGSSQGKRVRRRTLAPFFRDLNWKIPLFKIKAGETIELVLPSLHWISYTPDDLRIEHFPADAKVQVSSLRVDEGNGRDLLTSGWHEKHEFGGIATALAKREVVSSSDLRVLVTSDREAVVSICAVIQIEEDHAFGQAKPAEDEPPVGRIIRVRFEKHGASGPSFHSKPIHWGNLRVRGIVFEGDLVSCFSTVFNSPKVDGGPDLTVNDGWSPAIAYRGLDHQLRFSPMLMAGGTASIQLNNVLFLNDPDDGSMMKLGLTNPSVPYLVCEVVEDFGDSRR